MSTETTAVVWNSSGATAAKAPRSGSVRYGVQLAVMAAAGAALFYWGHLPAAIVVWTLGGLTLLGLLGIRCILRGFDRVGAALVWLVGTGLTWLLLTPLFYIVFSVGHLCRRMAGRDPLQRKRLPDAATYWNRHDNSTTAARYQKQY